MDEKTNILRVSKGPDPSFSGPSHFTNTETEAQKARMSCPGHGSCRTPAPSPSVLCPWALKAAALPPLACVLAPWYEASTYSELRLKDLI